MLFAIDMVGTYKRQCKAINPKKIQNEVSYKEAAVAPAGTGGRLNETNASPAMASPPTKWLKAINLSAEKFRSANWLLKNIPMIADTGKALKMNICSRSDNPMAGK